MGIFRGLRAPTAELIHGTNKDTRNSPGAEPVFGGF